MAQHFLDGAQVGAALREIVDVEPKILVIRVTGDGDSDRVRLAMEAGACGYITKPIDLANLKASVAANLLNRKSW